MKINKEEIYIFVKQNLKTLVAAFLASLMIVFAFLFFHYKGEKPQTDNFQNYSISSENLESTSEVTENKSIFIDIKGQVKNPGLYEMTREERVNDAIQKAGGLLADADTSSVNLSQKLKDQMIIVVEKKGERKSSNSAGLTTATNSKKVININLATKEELMQISGVGETRAQAIIDYRENKGDFKKIEDIRKVKGIGKASFEKIKDQIEV